METVLKPRNERTTQPWMANPKCRHYDTIQSGLSNSFLIHSGGKGPVEDKFIPYQGGGADLAINWFCLKT